VLKMIMPDMGKSNWKTCTRSDSARPSITLIQPIMNPDYSHSSAPALDGIVVGTLNLMQVRFESFMHSI
jgi:hypothetical protein